ncbi:MAG: Rid family detoxifying hydrolase [Myxococcota bacterium]
MSHRHKIVRIPSSLGLPFSTAVRVGDVWELSGQIGLDPKTGKLVSGGVGPETKQTLENIKATLEQAGSSLRSVIKVSVFLKDIADFDAMNKVYASFFEADDYPARSAVAVAGLALSAHVEIECSAVYEK